MSRREFLAAVGLAGAMASCGAQGSPAREDRPAAAARGAGVFVAGVERDVPFARQVGLVRGALPAGTRVVAVRHSAARGEVARAVAGNPGAAVVLFSAGCARAMEAIGAGADPDGVWLVEPWAVAGGSSRRSVIEAIGAGVPAANVVSGPTEGRGAGIPGATKTPAGLGHFDALAWAASRVR